MSELPPPVITITHTDPVLSNVPIGSLIAACWTNLINAVWSLDPASSDALMIDGVGNVISKVSPLPKEPMIATVLATSDTTTLSSTFPIPVVQMPEFRGLSLTPNTHEFTTDFDTVIGTLAADTTKALADEDIIYTLVSSTAAATFTIQDRQLVMANPLVAGIYGITIELSSSKANSACSFTVTVTLTNPPSPPSVQEQATQISQSPVVTVVCASNSGLNGDYLVNDQNRGNITGIALGIKAGLGLPSGMSAFNYPDVNGTQHSWNADAFVLFAKGVMVYIYNLSQVASGEGTALPNKTIAIP